MQSDTFDFRMQTGVFYMNLYHLRYFVTLAKMQHYTKAAEQLCITQPSLSHAISSLEKEMGVKLFEKEGRNIVLTKCGTEFLKEVERSLEILDNSVSHIKAFGSGDGRLDIALLRTLGTSLVPDLIRGFVSEYPYKNIDFHFYNGLTSDILDGLKEQKYDIAFCSCADNEPLIDFIPISRQELVLIVPRKHPLADRESIHLKETLQYPQILFSQRSGLRAVIDKLFEQCGQMPDAVFEIEEDQTIAGFVANGFGIAVVPDMPILNNMPLKVIHISEPNWERYFYMATLKNRYHVPLVENFKRYVEAHTDI